MTLNNYDSRFYDLNFSTDISNRMQIPDRIGVKHDADAILGGINPALGNRNAETLYDISDNSLTPMAVPDRIIVAGYERVVESRQEPINGFSEEFSMNSSPQRLSDLESPPHVLTVSQAQYTDIESFHLLQEKERQLQRSNNARFDEMKIKNGRAETATDFDDGSSDEENVGQKSEKLRTINRLVDKLNHLNRRIQTLEVENERRQQRELILYPVITSYFFFKILAWLWRKL